VPAAVGADVGEAAEGDGDGEVVTTAGCGLEQLAVAASEAIRITRQRKRLAMAYATRKSPFRQKFHFAAE
jgi:hypothetical protein